MASVAKKTYRRILTAPGPEKRRPAKSRETAAEIAAPDSTKSQISPDPKQKPPPVETPRTSHWLERRLEDQKPKAALRAKVRCRGEGFEKMLEMAPGVSVPDQISKSLRDTFSAPEEPPENGLATTQAQAKETANYRNCKSQPERRAGSALGERARGWKAKLPEPLEITSVEAEAEASVSKGPSPWRWATM